MEILNRRVKSKNKKEKILACLGYFSSIMSLLLCSILFGNALKLANNPNACIAFLIATFFFTSLMSATNDFQHLEKLHKGTLLFFIAKINPVKSMFKSLHSFVIFPIIFIIGSALLFDSFKTLTFVCCYLILFTFLIIVIRMINNIHVLPDELEHIDDLEDIDDNEKLLLKKAISNLIVEYGYVSRGDLLKSVSRILQLKNKRIKNITKKENKDKYSKFIILNSGYYGIIFYKNENGERLHIKIKFPELTTHQHIQKWINKYEYCFSILNGNGDLKHLDENIETKRGIQVPETNLYIPLIFEENEPLKVKVWDGYSIDYINEVGEKVNVSKSNE